MCQPGLCWQHKHLRALHVAPQKVLAVSTGNTVDNTGRWMEGVSGAFLTSTYGPVV